MTNLKTKITTALVTGSFLAGIVLPVSAFADNTVTVSENGAGSTNKVKIKNKKKVKVVQSNSTAVLNLTGVFQNTGDNKANGNTGGTVDVNSGKAESNVTNSSTTGNNSATLNGCVCDDPLNTVDVTGNGADSTNTVKITNKSKFKAVQSNKTLVVNGTLVDQNTGENKANNNTGGEVAIDSGDAESNVTNTTNTGGNTLTVNP